MVEDARFEDGGEQPVALKALDGDDLQVISALVQDAVFPITEMTWDRKKRRFAVLLNRFRWEDRGRKGAPERVQSVLVFEDAMAVANQGIDQTDRDMVLSLLALEWAPGEDGTGRITLVLAGDGAVAIEVEALEVTLKDVTRPYIAPSGKAPDHPE
ncbi:DUF2948 family protein [Roseobacter sp. HKCCD9010]|uniref:DUF2948 family protein n=1 Tax=unclassified Roseobacter TaxID=196798 RepID=UPI001491687E|nr:MULTISPECIES: DUF2948 family protein [unclassified Roseobacter]MBF9049771.1 DUF2948 family protein [Rhodobacterales bacterium HKCCD4356]NNV13690.1 DUF2948 family protein [Roseobacter sp. HKCCD7357]NNV16524.1 DUF2948 family protein [Roseobacter sp. HKCCD8768]NNV25983.1 DUF2948 family protein [Roseobacter sp. HKCCD8192]NNV30243.1 DUF2948 family protein [Roseobacter sp. HKCCD9061]